MTPTWPKETQTELTRYFGPPGKNQVTFESPYLLRLSWDTDKAVRKFSCHKLVAPSLLRILNKVHDHYGPIEIRKLGLDLFGGCFNYRLKTGSKTKWSTHAWGIALDWDTANNQYRWDHTKARLAKPEYNDWWNIWEAEGWVSLGRTQDYDYMHVQASFR